MSKKQPRLTGLFPPSINPARRGVYQVEFSVSGAKYFSRWNGRYWCVNRWTPNEAAVLTNKSTTAYQSAFMGWRGLTVKP